METSKWEVRNRTPIQRKQISDGDDEHQNNISSCDENNRTKQKTSGECLKYLYSCKWRGGGLYKHLAASECLTVCLLLRASVLLSGNCALQYLSYLPLSLMYAYLLSVWLCTHLIIHLPAYLTSCLPSLSIQLSTYVPFCPSASHRGWEREGWKGGGGLLKGSQGTHRSACLWSLHYCIWHSARAHLISLWTHTYTYISAHIDTHTDKPDHTSAS